MLSKTKLALASALSIFFCAGCDKEPIESSPLALLTQKEWVLNSWTSLPAFNFNGRPYTNIFEMYASTSLSCSLDQQYVFSGEGSNNTETGSYIYYEGKNACNTQAPKLSGDWGLNDKMGSNTSIYLYQGAYSAGKLNQIVKVETLTANKLVLSYQVVASGTNNTFTWTKTFLPKN